VSDATANFTDDLTNARPPHDAIHDLAIRDSQDDARDDAGMDAGESPADGVSTDLTDPTEPPEHEVEGAVPPGYDWPTHGGYLGCLVGTIAACLVTGFFGANLFSYLYVARGWPFPLFALLTLVLFAGAIMLLGQLGWRLGRRFYRYYPQPKPTWGENDVAAAELAPTRPARSQSDGGSAPVGTPRREATTDVPGSMTDTDPATQPNEREALGVEGRERQDDGRDGGGEAADQAENAYQEPQRP
jgi:hypothetical protein